jgi:hypothetical protein
MRKVILLILSIISIILEANAQNVDFNQQKYWYLRWRLKNYFMVVGPNYGQSIPAGIRNRFVGDKPGPNLASASLSFGDDPNYLATYIGVLATEYHLLNNNNQDVSETVRELYYALNAINRLDNCEAQYPWNQSQNKLDGKCSRGDVQLGFVQQYYNQLNKNLNSFNPLSNPGDPTGVEIIYRDNYVFPDPEDKRTGMMSQDHISSIFMGLAFVTKFIPSSVTYNGMNLKQEAQNICFRIWSYMKNDNWDLTNPENNHIDNDVGGDPLPYAYGFTRAALFIDPNHSADYLTHIAQIAPLKAVWDEIGLLALTPSSLDICQKLIALGYNNNFCDNTGNTWIVNKLAAVGNSWENVGGPLCFVPGITCTQYLINLHSTSYGWQAYYPLIHSVLHNTVKSTANSTIEADLNSMPCSGHWAHGNPQQGVSAGWATSHKYQSPPSDNLLGEGGAVQGEYTGLEYMLLFNMYCIQQNGNYLSNYHKVLSEEVHVTQNQPTVVPFPLPPYLIVEGGEPGTAGGIQAIPKTIHAFDKVTSTSTIANRNISGTYFSYSVLLGTIVTITVSNNFETGANVTYKAGESINLLPGFKVKNGAYFHGVIDPLNCNSTGANYSRISAPPVLNEVNTLDTELLSKQENLSFLDEYKIFPNPTTGKFTLKYAQQNSTGNIQLELLTVTGESIYNNSLSSSTNKFSTEIDLVNFPKGIYLFRLIDGEQIKNAKIVVQ